MYGGLKSKIGYKPFKTRGIPAVSERYSPFYNLRGGINTRDPSHLIADNELADAYNVDLSTWGLKTRTGKTKYNSVEISGATSIRGLHTSYATGSRVILAADDQGIVYKDDGTGTFTTLKSGLTADSKYFFEDWLSYTFWVNGNDGLYRWDGSNVDLMTNAATGMSGIINAENRLFGWKATENNLYFCGLRAPNDWTIASEYSGFLVVPQVKGDFIVTCARQGRTITVFKNNSIWRYYLNGLPRNWTRELVSDSLGIAGKYALDTIEGIVFFMGNDGRIYQLSDTVKLISDKIDSPNTDRWGLPTDLNMSKINETIVKYMPTARAVRVIYNDVSSVTNYPNLYADYYIVDKIWLRGNLSAYNMTINSGKNDNGYMYVGDPTSGYIYRINTGTNDNSSAIESYFNTKAYDFGAVDLKKVYSTVYISSKPTGTWNASLTEYIDFDTTGTTHNVSQAGNVAVWDTAVWDTDVWGGEGLLRSRVDMGNNKGHYVSYKFGINLVDKYWEIRGVGVKYTVEPII